MTNALDNVQAREWTLVVFSVINLPTVLSRTLHGPALRFLS